MSHSPSSTAPTYSPKQEEALDRALNYIDESHRKASWVKKAGEFHGEKNPQQSIQDFMKERKIAPGTEDIVQERHTPFLSTLPRETVKELIGMSELLNPIEYINYVDTILGIRIPLDKVDEFVERLNQTFTSLTE